MGPMIPVRVTVAVGRKVMALEEVKDPRVSGALKDAAKNIGSQLAKAKCPKHGQGPTDVRLHFDAAGNGDLKYESCCEELGKAISKLV
jgi:hypothetical protein